MPGCYDMKQGEVYACGECGLELKVMKACRDAAKGADTCDCGCSVEEDTCCEITCCGKPLVKKA